MARLTFAGVELQRPATGYDIWFEFLDGGPADGIYEVRGEDQVIPAKAGKGVRNRVPDHLGIVLVGWVEGQGATHSLKRSDYFDLMSELLAVLDPDLDPAEMVAWPPVDGVPSPHHLNARFLRMTAPAKVGEFFRKMTLFFECVDSPPVWTAGS